MKRLDINSGLIDRAGYDEAGRVMEIRFRRGGVYRYTAVPDDVWSGFLAAPSRGRYFQLNIQDSYAFERLR